MTTPAEIVHELPDPELPVITIGDLGIVRAVETGADGTVVVTITPTYSGCPAIDAIREEIRRALEAGGHERVEVRVGLRPAWTTDWISERGRERLREFGIAPPRPHAAHPALMVSVACPRCGSKRTLLVSRFGSTPCKAHRVCRSCGEPFDQFKEL